VKKALHFPQSIDRWGKVEAVEKKEKGGAHIFTF